MEKIAIYIISDGIGGAEQVVWQSLYGFKNYDNFYLITNNEIASYYAELLPDSRIFNIGNIFLHRNKKYKLIRYFIHNRFFSLKKHIIKSKTKLVTNYLLKNNINIIHCHLYYSLYSSIEIKKQIKNLRIIFSVHSAIGLIGDKMIKPVLKLNLIDFSKINNLIFVSKYVYDIYVKKNITINNYKIIYNGINPIYFSELERKNTLNESFKILFVGGSKFVKGYDLLVETVEELLKYQNLNKIKVTILGNISPDCELIQLIKEKKLSSVFEIIGFVKKPLHLEYFKKANLLFMPSRTEAMPMAAIEAFFLNLPIVASNVGGIPEIIKDGQNGFLCTLNPKDFANSILFVKNNYTNFIEKTKDYNNENKSIFTLEKMTNDLLCSYNQILY